MAYVTDNPKSEFRRHTTNSSLTRFTRTDFETKYLNAARLSVLTLNQFKNSGKKYIEKKKKPGTVNSFKSYLIMQSLQNLCPQVVCTKGPRSSK